VPDGVGTSREESSMVLKSVGVLSCGKVFGVIYGAFGLIVGAIFSLFSMVGMAVGATSSEEPAAALFGMLFGVGAIIILPFFYGVMGFIGGVITAAIYNLVARAAGGIELELE
jgi:hypothetical protein